MKISLFWLFCAVEGGRYYAKMKAQKAAAKTQMMIRDADGVIFLEKTAILTYFQSELSQFSSFLIKKTIFIIFLEFDGLARSSWWSRC